MSKLYTKEQAKELNDLVKEHNDAINAYGADMFNRGFRIGGFGALGGFAAMVGVFKLVFEAVNFIHNKQIKNIKNE